jgi:uncharacterized protein
MRFLIALGHPAHYHLFKNVASRLKDNGHEVHFAIRQKDVLRQLLEADGQKYAELGASKGRWPKHKALQYLRRLRDMAGLLRALRPDLVLGTNGEVAHTGFLLRVPNMLVTEDDYHVTPLYARSCFPFARHILAPDTCDLGRWEKKAIHYPSYHELAYLHPNHFRPDRTIPDRYFGIGQPYFILRFVNLTAHHDHGIRGISGDLARRIVQRLSEEGRVYISAERSLEPDLEPYRIRISPEDMHHVLAFTRLFVGDSQTMAAECAVLGTPYIRCNDFVGRIGYLRDLEENYQLGVGISPSEPDRLLEVIDELLGEPDLWMIMAARRARMLSEKLDAASQIAELLQEIR